jgi:uncharacterized repeat protein (TIGR01451 family)
VTRRIPKKTIPGLAALALAALAFAPGLQAARLTDANLSVSLTSSSATPVVGETVSYTATVLNNGPERATSASLTVTVSGRQASITAASGSIPQNSCTLAQGAKSARCLLGTLDPGSSTQMTFSVAARASGTVTVTAKSRSREYDPVAADSLAQERTHFAERVPPVTDPLFSTGFAAGGFSPHHVLSLRWRATDTGSGVATYDVRYRAATVAGDLGPYKTWLAGTREHGGKFNGRAGSTYCFSYRATDADGNASAWTADRCVSVQLAPIALRRTSGWIKASIDGALRTQRTGAALTLAPVAARRIVLSALVGPNFGRIEARWNGQLLRTIDLSAGKRQKVGFTLGAFPTLRRGTLALRVVSLHGAVTISALGIGKQ